MTNRVIPDLPTAIRNLTDDELDFALNLMHRYGAKEAVRTSTRVADLYWAFAQVMRDEQDHRNDLAEHARRAVEWDGEDLAGRLVTAEDTETVQEILAHDRDTPDSAT